MMRGYRMKLFWLQVSFIFWWILWSSRTVLQQFCCPYYQATLAQFYLAVRKGEPGRRPTCDLMRMMNCN